MMPHGKEDFFTQPPVLPQAVFKGAKMAAAPKAACRYETKKEGRLYQPPSNIFKPGFCEFPEVNDQGCRSRFHS